jgi:hypothetical protein
MKTEKTLSELLIDVMSHLVKAVVLVVIYSLVIMLFWNVSISELFEVSRKINFRQALGFAVMYTCLGDMLCLIAKSASPTTNVYSTTIDKKDEGYTPKSNVIL